MANIPLFQLDLPEPEFQLSDAFLDQWQDVVPTWGPVGEFTFKRTYSRAHRSGAWRGVTAGNTEEWWQTCARVVEGTYTIQQRHCYFNQTPWDGAKAQASAQEMYERMFEMKFLPPGRGLWMMGTPHVARVGAAALNNCSALSTSPIHSNHFEDVAGMLMDLSMLGVGVGYDTLGAGHHHIHIPRVHAGEIHTIPDTREGWINATKRLIAAYLGRDTLPETWDYSQIRPEGTPILGFGGVASGPGPLEHLLEVHLPQAFTPNLGQKMSAETIADIFGMIGRCVVSGNVRRSALLGLGQPTDADFIRLKDPEYAGDAMVGPDSWRWTANLSVEATVGMDYTEPAQHTSKNGEPGYIWLDNLRRYSRMIDPADEIDYRVVGVNPCQPEFATVLTPEGIRTFSDIHEGSIIWTGKVWTKVSKKWSTGEQDVYAYRTRAGVFIGTENHKVFQNGERCEASEAETIDRIIGPAPKPSALWPRDIINGFEFKGNNIPDYVLKGSQEKVCGFLRGMYSANGTIHKEAQWVTIQIPSPVVRDQVIMLLSSVGIRACYAAPNEQEGYQIHISSGLELFRALIGFMQPSKQDLLDDLCKQADETTRASYKVKEVEHLGKFEVFDITVEDEEHCYWTGGLKVSNCAEMSLEHAELCTLVETIPVRHTSKEDYIRTLKYAYLYAKTVTLVPTHIPAVNTVMRRNRRIGVSQTGVVQNFARIGRHAHYQWCDTGYKYLRHIDSIYSDWLGVPRSIKLTTVKPSGSVSKLPGCTSGIHWPPAEYYIQRIRVSPTNSLLPALRAAGYTIEQDVYDPNSLVVEFPIQQENFSQANTDVPVALKMKDVADMQKWWSDNAVSCTVEFNADTEADQISTLLEQYERDLKTVSFLPYTKEGKVWDQAPWEPITREQYLEKVAHLKKVQLDGDGHEISAEDKFCSGDSCII